MKTHLKLGIAFFLMIYIFCSCNTPSRGHLKDKTVDTIAKDPTNNSGGNLKGFYLEKLKMEKMIGLDPMESGFDSLQIRIWYGVALMDKLQLLVLKKSNSKWSAQFYSLRLQYDKHRDSLVSVTKNMETKEPVSGWERFVDDLFKLDILILPDSRNIKGYEYCNDGDGATFEISTIKNSRMYSYPCFDDQVGIEQAKNVEKIMKLLENEFNFRRLSMK